MKTLTQQSIRALLCTSAVVLSLLAQVSQLSAAQPGKTQPLSGHDSVPEGLAPSDWTSIRAAYEAQRHAAFAVEGGYQARNPGQQWQTKFDARGFSTQPDAGGWQWGLELRSYGFAGQKAEQIEGQAQAVKVEGQRVTYTWDGALEEWFVNDQRGLEHGFTVKERPHAGAVALNSQLSTLNFSLTVRGGLRPELSSDGLAVRFVDADGTTVINYVGLKVWDADGKSLWAQFVPEEEGIRLSVDERGARYPITVDPIAQQAYLKASNPGRSDQFGVAVAISGDTVVIGADGEDSSATGVNGYQVDDSASGAGAVYVFVRSGATWTQQAYLKASNTDTDDNFGNSVAISGDTVVVGAPFEDGSSTGVNGSQINNSTTNAGAAYVFVRSNNTWTQQAYLKASNTGADDLFGYWVAISGDTVVVGAPNEDSNAAGINGEQANNNAQNSGAAYVFVRNGTAWTQQVYLKASNPGADDRFGGSVAISGSTVVVGAAYEDSINGDKNNNSAPDAGAAYVFLRGFARPNGIFWVQQAYLKASSPDAGDLFGLSVAISGDTVVIGAIRDDSNATGVNGDQTNNSATDSGAAYVFVRTDTGWTPQAYLKASNPEAGDYFGFSVAISGDMIVIGATLEASNAAGVNGDQASNSATESGAAYLFVHDGSTWVQQAYLKASNTNVADYFGSSVAISGDTVVVTAPGEDSNASGINGNQIDKSAPSAGAAYIFTGLGPSTLANISTRLRVGTGDNALIGGFIVTVTQAKKIIVRGIGPSLPFADRLANPTLELRDSTGALLDSNDNWVDSPNKQAIIDSTIPPANDLESAIVATLPANNAGYTAIVRGVNNTTGIGVVEAYDLDLTVDSQLANISTRGLVQTGDNVLIAGTIVLGPSTRKVIVRAIGPSLPVPGAMADPTLELRDANGALVRENDNWRIGGQEQEIIATTIPPSNDLESALIASLPANGASYTAIVRGVNGTTGIAVVEVYALQ